MSRYSDLIERRRAMPAEQLEAARDAAGHGKRSTYVHWFCRCQKCKAVNNLKATQAMTLREQRAIARGKRRNRPDLQQQQDRSGHGELKTYTWWFCRCELCCRANTRFQKQSRLRKRQWS